MSFVRDDINHFIAKIKWKLHFRNATSLGKYTCGMDNISIGRGTYGPISVLSSDLNPSLSIGSYCSIAQEVTFIIRDDHPLDRFSTYPFRVMSLGENAVEATGDGFIVVEDDVWIGYRSTILDGVRIGRGGSSLPALLSPRMFRLTQSLAEYLQDPSRSASPINLSTALCASIMEISTKRFSRVISRHYPHRCALHPSRSW